MTLARLAATSALRRRRGGTAGVVDGGMTP
jgi:hypothetical protein